MKQITNKKAISPIIATLLLILIAIAAGVVVYAYVVGFIGNSTTNTGGSTNTLSIDQLNLNHAITSVPVTAFVRNLGPATENFNTGYYIKGTSTNLQLVPAVSLTVSGSATGSDTVGNVTISQITSANQIQVKVTYTACATTVGTVTATIFGQTGTLTGCVVATPSTVTLTVTGFTFANDLVHINVASVAGLSVALANTVASVVGMNPTLGALISLPINQVGQFTLAQTGSQTSNPLTAGLTYTVQLTGTDGGSTTASAKSS